MELTQEMKLECLKEILVGETGDPSHRRHFSDECEDCFRLMEFLRDFLYENAHVQGLQPPDYFMDVFRWTYRAWRMVRESGNSLTGVLHLAEQGICQVCAERPADYSPLFCLECAPQPVIRPMGNLLVVS